MVFKGLFHLVVPPLLFIHKNKTLPIRNLPPGEPPPPNPSVSPFLLLSKPHFIRYSTLSNRVQIFGIYKNHTQSVVWYWSVFSNRIRIILLLHWLCSIVSSMQFSKLWFVPSVIFVAQTNNSAWGHTHRYQLGSTHQSVVADGSQQGEQNMMGCIILQEYTSDKIK